MHTILLYAILLGGSWLTPKGLEWKSAPWDGHSHRQVDGHEGSGDGGEDRDDGSDEDRSVVE